MHLLLVAYLATFIMGAASGAIHPACYAYVGAVLPLLTAFIYLLTCSTVRGFGAAALLNGFVFILFLIAGEADISYIIGTIVLTALAPGHWRKRPHWFKYASIPASLRLGPEAVSDRRRLNQGNSFALSRWRALVTEAGEIPSRMACSDTENCRCERI